MTTLIAGIYCRISKDRAEEALGVARQEKDCRELAARIGAAVGAVFIDNDSSAYSGKIRPQYVALLEAIEAQTINCLIVWHPDRLHRSPRELEDFVLIVERTGCEVRTVTAGDLDLATPDGRLVARITGAVARKESEDKSRRLKRKLLELRETGKPSGRLGYPYDNGGVLNPDRLAIVHEVADRIINGESCGLIAADLTRRGVPTRSGGQWTHTSVRTMMRSPSLVSLIMHKGEFVGVGNWPPALDRATWDRCGAAMVETPKASTGTYLLSGIAVCGVCRRGLTGAALKTPEGSIGRYRCDSQRGGCGGVFVYQSHLDGLVVPRVELMLKAPVMAAQQAGEDLAAQIAEEEARLLSYAEMLDAKELSREEWKHLRKIVADRINLLRAREEAQSTPVGVNAGEKWEAMTIARRRQIIARAVEITVSPVHHGPRFDPSRVRLRWLQ
jgi:site-specific DNA recombinase